MLSITNQSKLKIIILIVFAALTLFLTACNSQAEKLNLDGNEAFSEQAYLEALELYQSAQIESPELAEPYYNAANALYRQGDYPAALEQIQMALQYIDEVTLAESSLFNMGNTLFNSQDLGTAIEAYKQALLLDPADLDAKYNLELALQQQQEQQQEQEQQEQEQDQSEQEENQDQSGEDSESDSEQSNDEGQEQGEDEEESDNGENQDDQTQEGDQSEKDEQGDGDQEQDQGNAGGQPQEGEDQQEGEQPSQAPAPGQRMTEEQAKQLLAAIANDMQTLQERLGQLLFSQALPPAQDW